MFQKIQEGEKELNDTLMQHKVIRQQGQEKKIKACVWHTGKVAKIQCVIWHKSAHVRIPGNLREVEMGIRQTFGGSVM